MHNKPPEPELSLSFLKGDLAKEFQRLWEDCLRTRDRGIEYRMDFGFALFRLRAFLNQFNERQLEAGFSAVCGNLEMTPDEARHRIALAMTWDSIRHYLDERGSPVRMPQSESWVTSLFKVPLEARGEVWEKIYQEAIDTETILTAKWMDTWIANYKTPPVPSETVQEEEGVQITFSEELVEGGELIEEEVPEGAQPARAMDVPPGSPALIHSPGEGPVFKHPPEVLEAIERISRLCGHGDPEKIAAWSVALSDPLKIQFEDLLLWDRHKDEAVCKIGRLIHGDFRAGLRKAIRIVDHVVDNRTPISFLKNYCLASGGRWEHLDDGFRIVVTKL